MIYERDKMIGDKEKKIYDLKKRYLFNNLFFVFFPFFLLFEFLILLFFYFKKSSQELEKFKFVLDHKIRELKRDIGPREDEILRMKDQTN